ncbi:DUF2155 domain-containing protein [Novosphingobium sp. 1949]|uniref:DUF2155 domain-containing protein n=1 Tax=Novosphingobium organovorum TaxID=2930092 RepID=A0ABT0BIL3_9SPHN|nr:DUF2155 domain-containing protein [Novosphingobium organovorum]MCJ2184903.1 DUF2155 domain-containing protein [Novosphingobium organovorum]
MVLALLAGLAGCKGEPKPEAEDTGIPDAIAGMQAGPAQAAKGQELGTPNKDRVATLGILNKRNNLTQDLTIKPGESKRLGNLVVKLATCEKTLPWEHPQDEGAFVQVFVEKRATIDAKLAWHKVFSGWLFKNRPALNVVEDPVYDVWVKSCAMRFPGEDASPASAASASTAAKPASSVSAAPAAETSPAPVISETPAADATAD